MMKIASLLTTLAIVFGATYASECTMSQIEAAGNLPELATFEKACGNIALSGVSSTATVKKICENPSCLAAMKAVFKAFPKCEVQGLSLSAVAGQVDDACALVGSPSTSSDSKVATTAPTTSAASSSASGVSATAVAVVAAVYTYARV